MSLRTSSLELAIVSLLRGRKVNYSRRFVVLAIKGEEKVPRECINQCREGSCQSCNWTAQAAIRANELLRSYRRVVADDSGHAPVAGALAFSYSVLIFAARSLELQSPGVWTGFAVNI